MSFTKEKKKEFCILEYAKIELRTHVQYKFRTTLIKQEPERRSIWRWHAKFKEEGHLCPAKKTGSSSRCRMANNEAHVK